MPIDDSKSSIRNILDRPARGPAATTGVAELDAEHEYTAYAQGRVSRHSQLSLTFRCADGAVRAYSYAHFYSADSADPSTGFTVDFTHHKVRVTGRNLEMLLRLVCQYRVAEIREVDRAGRLSLVPDAPVVERLEFLKGQG